ncbi:hypothetical protein BD769DRAFT_1628808 [Suillus cothurnatus]|nr:hypothetical protein BD769DRAFT_1628808 [Suillus cothurnatus]
MALEYCPSTGYANSINENMDGADEIDEGGQVLHFKGDFFGHYTEEDFEWPDNHGVVEGDKDADESSDEEVVFDGEIGWEPAVLNAPDVAQAHHQNTRDAAEAQLGHASPYITHFPLPTAGAPVSGPLEMPHEHIYKGYSQKIAGSENIYAPFESKLDFDIALWAKMCGSALQHLLIFLLSTMWVHDSLGLSYKSSCELNNIIDKKLPTGCPQFRHQEIVVAGEAFDVYFQDVVECVKALYEDPEFAPYLVFIPERHYADKDKTMWLYHDMHTGKWWWCTQKEIEKEKPGVTIIPIILSSDKTQVTVFGNKTAYPHIKNQASQHCTITNLFHACMGLILEPLKSAGEDGLHMRSGDGITHRGHPLLACYVGDYPEQILVSGTMTDALFKPRDLESILAALNIADEDLIGFAEHCAKLRIKPIQHPFWQGLPKLNIFHVITPDVLHQLYQGLVKHMIAWIKLAFGEAEIDARCCQLPPNHNICIFNKGISSLTRICCFLLGVIIDIPLPNNISSAKLYPCHSVETLQLLDEALTHFHDNKDIFFNLPKLHSYWHYLHMIQDQMTLWLERQEKILWHASYVHWCLAGDPLLQSHLPPDMQYAREYKMMKHPSVKAATINSLRDDYDTTTRAQVEHAAGHVYISFTLLPIFHKVRYNAVNSAGHKDESVTIDLVHCQPAQRDKQGNTMPGHFDTVLVTCGNGGEKSVEGLYIIWLTPFPSHILIPKHLAYVEWFSLFTGTSERNHGMHKVSRLYKNGEQLVSIISVKDIRRSVHLIPKFGRSAPQDWTSSNILELCREFFISPFTDHHVYATIY